MRGAIVLLIAASWATWDQAPSSTPQPLKATIAARAVQPGELIVLTITSSRPLDDIQVGAFDRNVPAFSIGDQKWQALLGIDADVRPARYTVRVEGRANSSVYRHAIPLQVRPRKFPTRRLQVDPSFVNPPPEVEGRIKKEAALLAALWRTPSERRLWSGAFVRPAPGASSSRFGALSIFNGEPRGRHSGEDFGGDEGTPIVAPNAGRVVAAQDLYFSGNTVVIDHGLGLFSLLAHLSAIDVKEGESVTAGQQIGRLGATGRVTGPHLHWAVRLNGARIDPSSLLATLGSP